VLTLAAEQAAKNPLIPNAGEIVVGFIAFALVFWVLAKLAFPNIRKTYAERTDRIEGGIQRAEEAQAEAQRTLEQYRAQLAEARGEANRMREEARTQGQQILEELRGQAREEADRIRAQGEEQLAAERAQVVTQLRTEVGRLAVQLAERIVRESLQDDARQRRIVDDFLAGLEGGAATAAAGREK
jgi:F-type H+-transporting ATPase subunit b